MLWVKQRMGFLAVLLVSVFVIVACGSAATPQTGSANTGGTAASNAASTGAKAPEMPKVTMAVGGASCLCYLPTVLANQLGYYKEAGVNVELVDFKGGSKALTAVLGGSADVVSGFYDHTVELAAKGKALQAFVIYDQFPGLVLVVAPKNTGKIKTIADLRGKTVGVTAPGSSTDFFVKYLLVKAGYKATDASVVGVGLGATAVAAMEKGQVDAAVMVDPDPTLLKGKYPDLTILADTRSKQDTEAIFGGDYPAGALYAPTEWVTTHKDVAQRLTLAIVKTLQWIQTHTPEEIMAKMPPQFSQGNPELYLASLKNTLPMFSKTGKMDPKGAEAVLKVFSLSDKEVAAAKIDVTKTYDNSFAEKADEQLGVK